MLHRASNRPHPIERTLLKAFLALVVATAGTASAHAAMGTDAESSRQVPACVAIMLPSVQGAEGSAVEVATIVRDLFAAYLAGPSVQPIALEARLSSQAIEEARQRSCGHMLTVVLTQKRSGGGKLGRVAAQAAGTAMWRVPPSGGVATDVAISAAVGAAHAAASIAATTRARDELRLQYTLTRVDVPGAVRTDEAAAKAKAHGEDLLTPLVSGASERVLNAILQEP